MAKKQTSGRKSQLQDQIMALNKRIENPDLNNSERTKLVRQAEAKDKEIAAIRQVEEKKAAAQKRLDKKNKG